MKVKWMSSANRNPGILCATQDSLQSVHPTLCRSHITLLYYTVLYCLALFSTVLHWTMLQYTICIKMHHMMRRRVCILQYGILHNVRECMAFAIFNAVFYLNQCSAPITMASYERQNISIYPPLVCLFSSLLKLTSRQHQSSAHWPIVIGIHG